MRPVNTFYRLSEPKDIPACKEMWARYGRLIGQPKKLGWPTIVAERNGRLVGFLSTYPSKKAIIAGPLVVSDKLSAKWVVTMRLAEAYENILRIAKVTGYLFSVKKKRDAAYIKIIQRLQLTEEYGETTQEKWFKRTLQ